MPDHTTHRNGMLSSIIQNLADRRGCNMCKHQVMRIQFWSCHEGWPIADQSTSTLASQRRDMYGCIIMLEAKMLTFLDGIYRSSRLLGLHATDCQELHNATLPRTVRTAMKGREDIPRARSCLQTQQLLYVSLKTRHCSSLGLLSLQTSASWRVEM